MSHIIFRRMKLGNAMTVYARPRNGSVIGNETIVVCGMNRNEMRELREDHYQETVHEKIVALREAIKGNSGSAVEQAHKNACALLQARCSFVALSFDLLTQAIDDADLSPFNLAWPLLENVPTAAVIHS
ncbi:hypothetical protein [Mitsuaria sp. GD03876]|uniref:hypothetical protein n=1 Tax=Mitsuaria sp. GD03876 TaxID=2975399 RepID=UPI00244B1805|nr:hypothetical protein [Mitsuaria sp. GD03876]MDH0863176.1 hypothetical protein [Mitsuaria sp. GD03876]